MLRVRKTFALLSLIFVCMPVWSQNSTIFGPGSITQEGNSVYRGSFSPDGNTFMFFRKVAPSGEDYRIFRSEKSDGSWSEPQQLSLAGLDDSELYPSYSPDGKWLVFSSYRELDGVDERNANLWRVAVREDGFGVPEYLEGLSTPPNYDAGPWYDRDGRIHFVSTSADWRTRYPKVSDDALQQTFEDTILEPWKGWREGEAYIWAGDPSPDGSLMILGVSEIDENGRRLPSDLWISRNSEQGWSAPSKLGPDVNTDADHENFVVFSPDGSSVFFVRGFREYREVRVADLP